MLVFSDPAFKLHVNLAAGVEAPERLDAALSGIRSAEGMGVRIEHRTPELAPSRAIEAVHAPAYLERLGGLSAKGGGTLDPDTAMGPGSLEAATLASGAAMAAAEGALSGAATFAVVRPPGHHAGGTYAMGFCLINHAAVAARHAQRTLGVERVAVLDWDVHHGNGTQDIFYRDAGVFYLSVHRGPFYPGTGDGVEVGRGDGSGFTANVALPVGADESVYDAAFRGVFLPVLREFRPGLLIVSAGYDAHVADPLGGMRLTAGSFGRYASVLAALCREVGAPPPAFVLEGGYDLRALADGIAATARGAEEGTALELPAPGGYPPPIRESREALAPYWEGLK